MQAEDPPVIVQSAIFIFLYFENLAEKVLDSGYVPANLKKSRHRLKIVDIVGK